MSSGSAVVNALASCIGKENEVVGVSARYSEWNLFFTANSSQVLSFLNGYQNGSSS
uniref:Uncharacterized protein n=1 Tax=Arion vulgaris TaxID=1028688 RepID=A0A0B6ZRX3_9EUPU